MSDLTLARRLMMAFGPTSIALLGELDTPARNYLLDAGATLRESIDGSTCVLVLCRECPQEVLQRTLADARQAGVKAVYVRQLRDHAGYCSLAALENTCFAGSFRKHPAYYALFPYASLEHVDETLDTLIEPLPEHAAAAFPLAGLQAERDLHMDMLREAGRRSDAHIARYQWASKYVRPNDVVLDAACGLGYGTYVLRHASRGARYIGIDSSAYAIDYAKACFGDIDYKLGLLPEALRDMPDNSIDIVISFETLEHVPDPQALLKAFWRVLRPAGRVIVSVPNDWSDDSGNDPSPHHLHVYTWDSLAAQLAGPFLLESATRQIASACKRVDEPARWVERPRTLEAVDLHATAAAEAEWWLAVAVKSPLDGARVPYVETVHEGFDGVTHLIDYAKHYTNPWLLHGMVEIPYRIQQAEALTAIATRVAQHFAIASPEHGAALAVLAYRHLEATKPASATPEITAAIGRYLALEAVNPHIRRWQVSLTYIRARLHLRVGNSAAALEDYASVANWRVVDITPTLGTKVVDAALRAGMLCWAEGRADAARGFWQGGIGQASTLMRCDWIEFLGNPSAPLGFAVNDMVEIADRTAACAQALAISSRPGPGTGAALFELERQSLRSALRRVEDDLRAAQDAQLAMRAQLDTAWQQRDEQNRQREVAARLSIERLGQVHALQAQLADTNEALDAVTALSLDRLEQLDALDERIKVIHAALHQTQRLCIERLDQIHTLEARLADTDKALETATRLSLERMHQNMELDRRLAQTNAVLDETKAQLENVERRANAANTPVK